MLRDMETINCPYATPANQSCPVLEPGGACAAEDEVDCLVRAALAPLMRSYGVATDDVHVELGAERSGALQVTVHTPAVTGALAHRLAVRTLGSLCPAAHAANTINVRVASNS